MKMKSADIRCAVSALHYFEKEDVLFIGCGGRVEAFDFATSQFIDSIPLFHDTSHSIHGFLSYKSGFLVFGGKSLRFFTFEDRKLSACEFPSYEFKDWIHDIKWSKDRVFAVTSHNDVFSLDHQFGSEDVIKCLDEKCILYSASIICDSLETIVIGGTVFRQVILWACSGPNSGKLLHRISGHEGVIFSVQFSNESNLICSTSDDRTARLWKVEKGRSWETSRIEPYHILRNYHGARVFRCMFISSGRAVLTGGEDSLVVQWNTETGDFDKQWKSNDGSPVWSLASNDSYLVSGGGNGSIKKFLLQSDSSSSDESQILDLKKTLPIQDYPRIVTFGKEELFVLSQKGCLISLATDGSKRLLMQDRDLENYALMKVRNDCLYFATLNGKLKWLHTDKDECVYELKAVDGKIFSMELTSRNEATRILICGRDGEMKMYKHDLDNETLVCGFTLILPPSKDQRWFSCAMEFQGLLLVGDRNGNLHVYSSSDGKLLQSLPKVHGRHGIGFLKIVDDDSFLTGGRDGILKTFQANDKISLSMKQHLKVNWMEGMTSFGDDGDHVIGFHSSFFVIHSVLNGLNIREVDCGGGHRSWTFNSKDLAFVKDKEVFLRKGLLCSDDSSTIKTGLHILVINCVQHFNFGSEYFLVTGSEDTIIKILKLNSNGFSVTNTLRSHISSVKCLSMIDHEDSKLLISAGGRAQIKIWKLSCKKKLQVSELASKMLKGNDKQRQKSWKEHDLIDDTETRILYVLARLERDQLNMVLACSDGVIRLASHQLGSKAIDITTESEPFHNVVLKMAWYEEGFITTDTVGTLTFWSDFKPLWKVNKLHQNGINSLAVSKELVFTGSDDGSITSSCIKTKTKIWNVPCHAAHVSGLCIADDGQLISCSVDQRITVWKVGKNMPIIENQMFSHVPDVHDMTSWTDTNKTTVVVVGSGIEIFYC